MIRVAGVLIDDFLFHCPKELGKEYFQRQLDEADALMTKLGFPPNDKGQGPAQRLVFSGIVIDSIVGITDVEEEQRLYCIQRLEEFLEAQRVRAKAMSSINGSLGWMCVVIAEGRSRRDLIQNAADSATVWVDITVPL